MKTMKYGQYNRSFYCSLAIIPFWKYMNIYFHTFIQDLIIQYSIFITLLKYHKLYFQNNNCSPSYKAYKTFKTSFHKMSSEGKQQQKALF